MRTINNLENLSLKELDILKNHARTKLSDLERFMGNNNMGQSLEFKEFQTMSNVYKLYDDEMTRRVMETVIEDLKKCQ